MEKETGFKVQRQALFVGDIVSVQSGYGGFMEVVEREDGFWLVDGSEKVWGQGCPKEDLNREFKLTRDLPISYRKVDKNNPTDEPPMEIYCDQCDEVVTGYFDVETGDVSWTEECGYHHETKDDKGIEIESKCRQCVMDPDRRPPHDEVMEYFKEQYAKAEFKVEQGHWPAFRNKEEVDQWMEEHNKLLEYGKKLFEEKND